MEVRSVVLLVIRGLAALGILTCGILFVAVMREQRKIEVLLARMKGLNPP